jgi:diguanylate cyclase (GGDEF)-like protein
MKTYGKQAWTLEQVKSELANKTTWEACVVADLVDELERLAEDYIQDFAHHDLLTRLPNRALMNDQLEMALRRSQRTGLRLAVIMLDLDHFKRINDSLGHHTGDRLLQTAAQRLLAAVRRSNTVARMGGDEFAVLLDDIKDYADIDRTALAILQHMAEPVVEGAHELQVTTSLGISIFPDHGVDTGTLLKNAEAAMYAAKASGRNAYRIFDSRMVQKTTNRLTMEAALRHAIERGELTLHYQPQFDLSNGAIKGMEALVRWNCAELGPVSPAEFIPLAEEGGLILPIGHWVIEQACRDAVLIQQRIEQPVGVAVNLSPLQFTQPDLIEVVSAALHGSGLAPGHLELEITEGVFMVDTERTVDTVRAIRQMGVAVSIDDFGTGYSSLSYLTRYPVDRIKIDQSFISKLPHSANAAAVTTAIISIAHSLGMQVVAEGVETSEQFEYLQQRGCGLGQGYLFSKPLPLDEFVAWAKRHVAHACLNEA